MAVSERQGSRLTELQHSWPLGHVFFPHWTGSGSGRQNSLVQPSPSFLQYPHDLDGC